MVGLKPPLSQCQCDPAVPVSTFVLAADTPDHLSLFEVPLWLTQALQVIVITASGDTRDDQKQCQRIFLP